MRYRYRLYTSFKRYKKSKLSRERSSDGKESMT